LIHDSLTPPIYYILFSKTLQNRGKTIYICFFLFSQDNHKKHIKHPPRRENGTPPRRGIIEFIPPLRGDLGGCAFLFFACSLFNNSFIFRISLHADYLR
jgi:hypothetical protein